MHCCNNAQAQHCVQFNIIHTLCVNSGMQDTLSYNFYTVASPGGEMAPLKNIFKVLTEMH